MLMAEATGVNAPPRAVMMTISEVAKRDGVSTPAISRKVKRLVEAHGLQVERDRQGRVARINVAEFDHLQNRYADPSKAQAPRPPSAPAPDMAVPPGESYQEALRIKTWQEAEHRRLQVAELRGELVRVAMVAEALAQAGSEIAQVIERLGMQTDELALVVAKEGSHGLRQALKKLATSMCNQVADILGRACEQGPAKQDDEAAA